MLNCTAQKESFTANPDVVGLGVLAAFFVTAALTIIAVVFGYLTGSLDGDFLNDLDHIVIAGAKRLGNKIRRKSPVHEGLESSQKSNEARKEAIQQFILTLSDQQLVTGLAILICGVINQKSLSTFEFSVMLSLAWFSSTTHLATLDALRTYLKTHGVIRHVRVFGMVCVLIFLSYAFAITIKTFGFDPTIPVQCVFSSTETYSRVFSLDPVNLICLVLALVLIIQGYTVRIIDLYSEFGPSLLLFAGLEYIYILAHGSRPSKLHYNQLLEECQAALEKPTMGSPDPARSAKPSLLSSQRLSGSNDNAVMETDPHLQSDIYAHNTEDQSTASTRALGYEQQITDITSFFPRRVQLISDSERQIELESGQSVAENETVLQLKQEVLAEYTALKKIKNQIDHRKGLIIFFPSIIISILLGIFLNIAAGNGD
ncbi:hypothetical protein FGADI_5591, partial [Fusarium gaditjirri]